MAIVIEEDRNRTDFVRLGGWLAVIAVVIVALYYLFFNAPELVIISPSAAFQVITPISQVSLNPEEVLNSPGFRALQQPSFPLPNPQGPTSVGRTNPFLAP